ncbi:MAG: DUF3293 domain-containing protein [Dehalococcoidia bacterium]|nr:DUF3293 domain-containing protein [Dehalococcoidia bacterium]
MSHPASLEQLYRDAIYEVDLPGQTVVFRIGEAARAGLTVPLTLVTAFNPGTSRPCEEINRAANRRLQAEITRRGWPCFPARGRDATGTHVEPSFAITGISREDALALGREFSQAAIVFVDSDRVSLLWCE